MPVLVHRFPRYCRHKGSGQATVTLNGRTLYLGKHGTTPSKLEYERVIAEWLAAGKMLPGADIGITITEVIAAFLRWADNHYRRPDGTLSGETTNLTAGLRPLKRLYGDLPVGQFSPTKLQAVIDSMIPLKWSRNGINHALTRIKRMFKWAVAKELVNISVFESLRCVPGLQAGRSEARETDPVKPVDEDYVCSILPYASPPIAAMLNLQLLTGCRPGEVVQMRACDIEMTGKVWVFRPQCHKNAHRGMGREIFLGPRGQEIVKPFLTTNPQQYLFRPCDAEQYRRVKEHAARKTPLNQGNRPGLHRVRRPCKQAGEKYDVASYRQAIEYACRQAYPWPGLGDGSRVSLTTGELAEIRVWERKHTIAPNRIRHTFGTKIRRDFGLENASCMLGHSNVRTTQIYAEKNIEAARRIALEAG